MNMFKHTEVTTTQHYTYCSESMCSSYCAFLMGLGECRELKGEDGE